MYSARRRLLRPAALLTAAATAFGGLVLGLTQTPAAASSNSLALAVSTPETGAAANTAYLAQPFSYQVSITAPTGMVAGQVLADPGVTPANFGYVGVSAAGWSCSLAANLSCTLPLIPAGTTTATINLMTRASATPGPVMFSPALAPDGATAVPVNGTIASDADVSLSQVMDYPPPASGEVAWTYTITNNGPAGVSGPLTVTDVLPAGYTYLAPAVAGGTNTWACNQSSQTLTCTDNDEGGIAANSSDSATVTATVGAHPPRLTTEAVVSGGGVFDPDAANNVAPAPQSAVPDGSQYDPGPCGADSSGVRTCNLVALAGTLSQAITGINGGNPLPIWGFSIDGASPVATLPGPTLVATQGETLDLNVRNALPVYPDSPANQSACKSATPPAPLSPPVGPPDCNWLSVIIPGMTPTPQGGKLPGEYGVPSGSTTLDSSVYTNLQPGTFVYEASPSVNGARQVAMGLSGLLVVRPTNFQTGTATQALYAPTVEAAAPVKGAATTPGSTTTTTASPTTTTGAPTTTDAPTTTAAPAPTTTAGPTTTAAPAPTTTAAPVTTDAPTTTAAPAPTTTAATSFAADATTTDAPTTTAAPPPSTTTTAATSGTTTTTAPASGTTTTTTAGPPASPAVGAPVQAASVASPAANACNSPQTSSGFTAEALVQTFELSSQFHIGDTPFTSTFVPGGGNDAVNTEQNTTGGGSPDAAVYDPDVFLINGLAYPSTQATVVGPGDCVALHFVNMGLREKSMGVLGRREVLMSEDSFALTSPQDVANHFVNPGEEFDAVVDMNGSSPGAYYPIMDFEHHLHNGPGTALNPGTPKDNTGMTLGGMLALLQVAGPDPAPVTPVIDQMTLSQATLALGGGAPKPPANITLTSDVQPAEPLACAEWTIDTPDASLLQGSPCPGTDTFAGSASGDIPTSALTTLTNGDHIIWERVRDSAGDWSAPAGTVLTIDSVTTGPDAAGGPVLTNLNVNPTVTNGTTFNKVINSAGTTNEQPCSTYTADPLVNANAVPPESCDMILEGTATPSLPDWAIQSFTWTVAGAHNTVTYSNPSPGAAVEITDNIPETALQGLTPDATASADCPPNSPQGTTAIMVTATETEPSIPGSSRTDNPVPVCIIVTRKGPVVTTMNMTPNPAGPSADTDGNLNYAPSVRVYATLHDTTAGIVRAEMWYEPTDGKGNAVPATNVDGSPTLPSGQGVLMTASRGQWDLPPRLDEATVTSGSTTVLDPSIKTSDEGRSVSGTGIPAGATIGQVVAKGGDPSTYSFVIMLNGTAAKATGSAANVEIGSDIQAYTDLPSSEFNGYPQGTVKVWVHAQDEAGNWGGWTEQDLGLDKTEPVILDQTTAVKEPAPSVTRTGFNPITGIGTYTLHFWAEDPNTAPPPCTTKMLTPLGCGAAAQSDVAAIEWTISYVDSVDVSEINDFVQFFGPGKTLPGDPLGNGPENLTVNISGGPQPYTAPAKVEFRIMDGAGNWTNWYYTNLP